MTLIMKKNPEKLKLETIYFLIFLWISKEKRKNLVSYRSINTGKVHTRAVSTPERAMFSRPGSIFSYTLIICIPETFPSKLIGALYRKIKKG